MGLKVFLLKSIHAYKHERVIQSKDSQQMATFTKWKCLGYGKYSLEINEYNTGNKLSTFAKREQRAREFPKDGGSFR